MALKARLPNLDNLSDAIKALYRQVDDHFVLDVEPVDGYALEDINGLKTTLAKKTTEITTLKNSLQAFGDMKPDDAKAAIAKLAEYGNLNPEEQAKAKVKAALDQQQSQFNAQLTAKDTELKSLMTQLQVVMVDNAASSALSSKGGNVKLLLPHLRSQLRMDRTESGFAVNVIDAEGNARIHYQDGKTSNMTLDQLVDEMSSSQDFAAAFKAVGTPGNGTKPGNANPNGNPRPKVVDAGDQNALSRNLEDIAKGAVTVANL